MTPPDASELLLIRHAPARHNGRLCGRTDVPADLGDPAVWSPLRALVSQVDQRLVSPALRCRQTAQALWPGAALPQDERLWEQDFGAEEGVPFSELPDLGPLAPEALAARQPPGGESFAQMVERMRPALMELAEQAAQKGPIAIVAHAGTARAGLALALNSTPAALGFEIAPWSVTRLRAHSAGLSIISSNWRPLA